MNMSRLVVLASAFAGLVGFGSTAYADAAAGKATFTNVCAECHEVGDFDGEDPKEVAATIKSIVGWHDEAQEGAQVDGPGNFGRRGATWRPVESNRADSRS